MNERYLKWTLLPRERSNEDRARDAALMRLDSIPQDELVQRIDTAVARGDVVAARQYGRALDRRSERVFGTRVVKGVDHGAT